jgi:hypothetical protein
MADVLPGFIFDRNVARFRDTARGQFVSRSRITELMEAQVNGAEQRLANIAQGVFDKSVAPGVAQELMRDELRRVTLENRALGAGGLDQLTFRDYGAAGRQLRDSYQRMTNLVSGIERGEVTLPQALRRIEGYTLEARNQFFAAQRDAQANSGRVFEERRILHAAESCPDCIDYAAEGWVAQGQLPMIGESSQCQKYCRCTMESREVTPEMMQARLAERISA